MLNIHELENKHKKYKLKSFAPYLVILLSITIVLISILFFLLYDLGSNTELNKSEQIAQKEESQREENSTSNLTQEKNETLQKEISIPEIVKEVPKTEEVTEAIQKKVLLSPSLNFIKSIESQAPIYKEKVHKTAAIVEQQIKKPIQKKEEILLPAVEEVKESMAIVEKTGSIDIKRRDEEVDIKHVIKRFNINHNPALSLFVAKKYYQLEDYEQAYNYALATNELNNDMEASWIIFSKSLVKLGKKEMAVETLKKYINYSSSSQAKQLLDEILSGKFK
ncbi:CDC27 family protein [Sulfurimonas sp.]|jgi:tetratricopeptide (TPR) repeat protein|uniref:CDC27 family protein n=1 Tax=Sulfurimonas sp. TaxID=2022749 RepID=UPI0025FE991E|nr:CDC27 family protein [Sulfurimonas sp.]MCK9473634.1 CDC27 family protein [Sulfurimonas sp.]MDD3506103.1 hypothetical protein [Sulfurimonas sp.]